ncbi:dipeptidyl peptidase IV N-terminal region-domain-containing protein [Gorgonomyces haynaldii]|nr:dipeptidyl peptidase IV N-terminal region-domain-containing protein [Gorgonomyces haynaldii]
MHLETNNKSVLGSTSDWIYNGKQLEVVQWDISPDLKYILLETQRLTGWRHSFYAKYFLFDLKTRKTVPIDRKPKESVDVGRGMTSLVVWAPNGHTLAWVQDNDITVTIDGQNIAVTSDGSHEIINGQSDWVYEEEILSDKQAMWFSDDGNHLGYLKFNDTLVKEYRLQYYERYDAKQYPAEIALKYPKPGTPNPFAQLFIADLQPFKTREINLDCFGPETVFTQVQWIRNQTLLVRCMNRVQDYQKLFAVEAPDWKPRLLRDEPSSDGAWFERRQPLYLINTSYVELLENEDGFAHLAYFDHYTNKKPTKWLTNGPFDIASVEHVDDYIYYASTEEGSIQRHIYRTDLNGNKEKLTPKDRWPQVIQTLEEQHLGFYSTLVSPKGSYYTLSYQGPDPGWERLYRKDKSLVRALNDGQHYRDLWSQYDYPKDSFMTIKNDNGDDMNCRMTVPADFDPKHKYPLFMEVYGGPGSQKVDCKYSVGFQTKMAHFGMVYMKCDGRGTGFKGRKFRSAVSKQLGKYEAMDQIKAAKHLIDQGFIDPKRVGIWGWSYGGYTTLKVLESDQVFTIGVAVAPVTDWLLYDTMYTERFMKTPQENAIGYAVSAVKDMKAFKHTPFLLIHGLADDNVHFQNSARFVWDLTGAGVKSYTTQFYTDSDHSIYHNGANPLVYDKLQEFVCSHYQLECK